MMLIVVFSLSPCSLKRDLLGIFDIQHISSLNKIRATSNSTFSCDSSVEVSSKRIAASKADFRSKEIFPFTQNTVFNFSENTAFQNNYSGITTGNSPPKYILFKRLKLHVV
ncbi:hypothetical protein [Chryseobacterium angstadtii]|nr:hypothetical protein [Chryseobacterium angstadtii]